MDGYLRGLDMFHDAKFYDSKAHGPGLITGLSKFGKRVYCKPVLTRIPAWSPQASVCCAVHPAHLAVESTVALDEIMEYDPVLDSSNMSMSDWARIARDIDTHYSNWDAFVIMHGTDTMAYSATLSFRLALSHSGMRRLLVHINREIARLPSSEH